jgi:uncharacterized protein (DUF2126 family)
MSDPVNDSSLALDPRPVPGTPELIAATEKLAAEFADAARVLAGIAHELAARLARANRANQDLARRLADLEARAGTPDLYPVPQAEPVIRLRHPSAAMMFADIVDLLERRIANEAHYCAEAVADDAQVAAGAEGAHAGRQHIGGLD